MIIPGNKEVCRTSGLGQISGFTLLELIASLVLLGLLTAIFGLGIVAAMKSYEFSRVNVQLAQKGQLAMARISRELTELTRIEAITNSLNGEDPYIIYKRLPDDATLPPDRYGIHFDPLDQTVRVYSHLTAAAPLNDATKDLGDILVDRVSSFRLDYLSGNGTWAWGSDPRLLSSIGVSLRLERPDSNSTQDFHTTVQLRNTENYGGAANITNPPSQSDYSCFIATVNNCNAPRRLFVRNRYAAPVTE